MRLFLIAPADLGDILHPHQIAIGSAHRDIGDFIDGAKRPAGLHIQTLVPRMHRPRRQIGRSGAQGVGHGGDGQAKLRQPAAVDGDAHLRRRHRPCAAVTNAGNAVHPLPQVLRQLFKPAIARRVTNQCELQNSGFGGAGLLELQPLQRRRQRRADGVHFAHHLVIVLFRIAAPAELGSDDRGRIGGSRLDANNAVKALDDVFDRLGDRRFHVRRLGTRHGRNNIDERRRKMRIDRSRNGQQR